jgi:hypothetical protein
MTAEDDGQVTAALRFHDDARIVGGRPDAGRYSVGMGSDAGLVDPMMHALWS